MPPRPCGCHTCFCYQPASLHKLVLLSFYLYILACVFIRSFASCCCSACKSNLANLWSGGMAHVGALPSLQLQLKSAACVRTTAAPARARHDAAGPEGTAAGVTLRCLLPRLLARVHPCCPHSLPPLSLFARCRRLRVPLPVRDSPAGLLACSCMQLHAGLLAVVVAC